MRKYDHIEWAIISVIRELLDTYEPLQQNNLDYVLNVLTNVVDNLKGNIDYLKQENKTTKSVR